MQRRHLKSNALTHLQCWKKIFLYLQDIILCPFKSSFWSNISQIWLDKIHWQIILMVQHFTNLIGQNSSTANTLKTITQDVWGRCSVIMSKHNVQLARHFQNLVRLCLMKTCYFQHYISVLSHESQWLLWNQTNKVLHQYKWEATYFLFNHFNYHYTK